MQDKVGITFKQVENPSRHCSSGHIAPETFKNQDTGLEEQTRFFYINGPGISGIYCEPCLCIANYIAGQIRKKRE
jgi:hypothetical protein